ncbi:MULTISPECIES: peptidylprolyl isomerase [unclassified Cellvibrio]|uniref:peptidylprolyl isomerase n=1 Tax=unclassified Cellvibrio TaxID=2624793 RepID=UPI001244F310|nr:MULTISPECIES: peptidylprolyl isomerase [unclassified Cellvibrio]QEY12085.1 molecular chaperone SurA [Cellvibrio sp. KY-YJ-3]UUA72299.1 peptidylprolyl isomerase [Cellvibrio sp. QJXJ]
MSKRQNPLGWKVVLGGLLLIGSQLGMAQNGAVSLDRVVAIVDKDVVLESELNARKVSIMERLRGQYQQLPPEDVLNKQILEQLIIERIELGMAERYEITIEESEIDQAIGRVLQKNQITLAQLEADLQRQGLNLDGLRKQMRNELTINNLQQGVVNSRIKITEQDINNFLASSDGKYATSPDYHIGHILIAVSSSADAEAIAEAEKQANDIYQKLLNGSDFAQMAISFSNDQAALQGGDIGWRKLAQLPELFGNQMLGLAEGQVSKPFRSGAGFHILKNIEQRGGGEQLVEQTHARHILVKTSEIMDDAQARQKLLDLKARIEKGEDFAVLARENSEDTGSMLSGGDLGWSMPGMFVAEFEEAMKNTPINGISRPFKSQFGWHILQVLERRKEDMSDKMKRNQAANVLRARRFDEEFQLWLTQIREEAYVEIKL